MLPFFPLANGLLTGKYRRGEAPPAGTRLAAGDGDVYDRRAWDASRRSGVRGRRGLSMLDVAIGGLAAQPAVASVIAGATSPEQVRANAAAGEWEPDDGRSGRAGRDRPARTLAA